MFYTLDPHRIRTIITLQQLFVVQISAPPWLPVFVHRILTLLPRCCVYEATSGASSWAPASSSPLTNRIHIIKEQTPISRNCSSHHRAPAVLLHLESVRRGGKKMNIETAANCFNPASNPLTPQTDQYSIFCAMACSSLFQHGFNVQMVKFDSTRRGLQARVVYGTCSQDFS